MNDDATGTSVSGEVLARRLAEAHETYAASLAVIEADLAAGQLTPAQAQAAATAASAAYERGCALARIAHDTGWHTWVGVGGILYARRPLSRPPWTVRAADPDGLRAEIARKEGSRS